MQTDNGREEGKVGGQMKASICLSYFAMLVDSSQCHLLTSLKGKVGYFLCIYNIKLLA